MGIDISAEMIVIAQEISQKNNYAAKFLVYDAADEQLYDYLKLQDVPVFYNNAILLGNAIASVGSREKGKKLLDNIFLLTLPGGRLFAQTVHRPARAHYLPLRHMNDKLVQRIMVPISGETHNMELHVNVINAKTGAYESRKSDNEFFMFTRSEFAELVKQLGWQIKEVFGGYGREEVVEKNGATLVWVLEKPEIPLFEETVDLFAKYANIKADNIRTLALQVWQRAMKINRYRCIESFRFLFPRISSHSQYDTISKDFASKWILDIGCNMGTDMRKMIIDGARSENIVGIDLWAEFIELGYELFKDTDTLGCKFYALDILDNDSLDVMRGGGALHRYKSWFNIIHAGSLLHLLDKEQNSVLFEKINYLLTGGGIFFGRTVGKDQEIALSIPGGFRHQYSVKTLKKHLEMHGFNDIEIDISGKQAPEGERSDEEKITLFFYAVKP